MQTDNIIFSASSEQAALNAAITKHICGEQFETNYVGYAARGAQSADDAKFAILRTITDLQTKTTTYMWANGSLERKLPFTGCENLEYSFLK